ncbi:two-component sensor histidine kinase [Marinifilum sp. N1E240]|uniref:ATP-binding protein n=1 Tax=Marinifilum sp. N1E240 TaxID=2608082 RepID=UPI00128E0EF1|nr:ATP-binding protein [Marinifilum sp. N1E240]MPQ46798.1 two-component sensor histidine kinase [Marinifilum sp. N1E240]
MHTNIHTSGSKYKKRLFFFFFIIVLIFSILIGGFQYQQERAYRREKLEYALNIYTEQVQELIRKKDILQNLQFTEIDSLRSLIPDRNIRISVITLKGDVIYDSDVEHLDRLDNHLNRPEVQKSLHSSKGSNIRLSGSTGQTYYYYSKHYYTHFVRTALPFNDSVVTFLKSNNIFLYFLIGLFGVTVVFLIYATEHFGNSISKLRKFAINAAKNRPIDTNEDFGKTELGEISKQIVKIYEKLSKTKEALQQEKDKLFAHLQIAQEGVAVFDKQRNLILWNSHFIDYINYLSNISTHNYQEIFDLPELEEINDFINTNIKELESNYIPNVDMISSKKTVIIGHKVFLYQVVVFPDCNFEISIHDNTKLENEKTIKQEMTLNIAHELKTPVTAVSGFLETIKDNPTMPEDKKIQFIERSCVQINRLSNLIQDISVLTKMEEAQQLFSVENVDIKLMLDEMMDDFELKLEKTKMKVDLQIPADLNIKGNSELLDSIFRNLIDNSIKYAGDSSLIEINNYFEDNNYHYFSFADNGIGIQEKHLPRIFERFYRADNGRARKMGGTGLGLSIVKNAVSFHQGRIFIKARKEGGIEFFFSLKKQLS